MLPKVNICKEISRTLLHDRSAPILLGKIGRDDCYPGFRSTRKCIGGGFGANRQWHRHVGKERCGGRDASPEAKGLDRSGGALGGLSREVPRRSEGVQVGRVSCRGRGRIGVAPGSLKK